MGAWGVGIFDDDVACEIRELYRDLLGDGYAPDQVRDAILQHWSAFLEDVNAGPVIVLALALTQWKLGRLDDGMRERALSVIRTGAATVAWEGTGDLHKREAALAKAEQTLLSPQPAARKLRKRFRDTCDWQRGELISYRLLSGNLVVFRMLGCHTDRGGSTPVVEVLDWVGAELPPPEVLHRCAVRTSDSGPGTHGYPETVTQLFLGRMSERQLPVKRVACLRVTSEPTQEVGGFAVVMWRTLDTDLREVFGIE
ncbi:MAG: hypothetical protein JNK87_32275 [Bryobacterales bacterium]|nr:hypothetical protein [Bryobacterales bacterium]